MNQPARDPHATPAHGLPIQPPSVNAMVRDALRRMKAAQLRLKTAQSFVMPGRILMSSAINDAAEDLRVAIAALEALTTGVQA